MLFYSMLNSENKIQIKKFLKIMPFRFSNDLFALKKCHIIHKQYFLGGYQAFNEHSADWLTVAYIFEN